MKKWWESLLNEKVIPSVQKILENIWEKAKKELNVMFFIKNDMFIKEIEEASQRAHNKDDNRKLNFFLNFFSCGALLEERKKMVFNEIVKKLPDFIEMRIQKIMDTYYEEARVQIIQTIKTELINNCSKPTLYLYELIGNLSEICSQKIQAEHNVNEIVKNQGLLTFFFALVVEWADSWVKAVFFHEDEFEKDLVKEVFNKIESSINENVEILTKTNMKIQENFEKELKGIGNSFFNVIRNKDPFK